MLRFAILIAAAATVISGSVARADRKSFSHTYEYATLPEGATELEIWHTQLRDTWNAGSPQRFEEKLEIEHGITDHWDMAMYTVLQEVAAGDPMVASPLGLDSVHLETRYRIGERGDFPVDTVLYFEGAKDFGQSIYELEGKVIAARDFDRITAAFNAIGEVKLGHDVPSAEKIFGGALGVTYEITPKVRAGAEAWGEHGLGANRLSVGPAIGLAPSGKFWVAMTAGFAVADHSGGADLDQSLGAFSGRIVMGLSL